MRTITLAAAVVAAGFVATPALAACDTVDSKNLKLSFCLDQSEWVQQEPQGDQEFLYFSADGNVGFTLITETDTFTPSAFREAVLTNARNATDGKEVTVGGERVENIGDKPWNFIRYEFGEPAELEFQNFYYSQPGFGSVQFVFWSAPSDVTVAAYRAGKILGSLQYGN